MNILAFDTASSTGAVAIIKNDVLVAASQLNVGLTHSEQLLPEVVHLMEMSKTSTKDLDAIAITCGPGSFTGLRIGFSTAKGMAMGIHKPLVPVPTLDVLAQNGQGFDGLVVPIMNARRNQVYTAIYSSDGQHIEQKSEHQAIGIDELLAQINSQFADKKVFFTGDGVDVFRDVIMRELGDRAVLAQGTRKYVCADHLAFLALAHMEQWSDMQGMRVEPLYLRASEAVIKWKEAHPGERLED